ncbi:unnamed protein product, partial [Candidula unifasciata]
RNQSRDIIIIRNLEIVPFPIVVPGPIYVSLDIEFTQALNRNLSVEVIIRKRVLSRWTRLPCNNRLP